MTEQDNKQSWGIYPWAIGADMETEQLDDENLRAVVEGWSQGQRDSFKTAVEFVHKVPQEKLEDAINHFFKLYPGEYTVEDIREIHSLFSLRPETFERLNKAIKEVEQEEQKEN